MLLLVLPLFVAFCWYVTYPGEMSCITGELELKFILSGFSMVTTHGAGKGGKLCDRESKSCAASVSSALRSRKMESLDVDVE